MTILRKYLFVVVFTNMVNVFTNTILFTLSKSANWNRLESVHVKHFVGQDIFYILRTSVTMHFFVLILYYVCGNLKCNVYFRGLLEQWNVNNELVAVPVRKF